MISVVILTKNSSRTLKKTLDSVSSFPEVIIADTGSMDSTLDIAKSYPNVKIAHLSFQNGFGPTRNVAASHTSFSWILSLDSDEVLTKELSDEILSLTLDSSMVYSILRDNYFNGKHIKGCSGWYPDWITRLYNKEKTHFTDDEVHEKIQTSGLKQKKLRFSMKHTPYLSIEDFLAKMQKYSSLFAKQKKGKKVTFSSAFFHALFAFVKSYFFKRGFTQGKEGYIISSFNAQTTFYKYLKLMEINRDLNA